MFPQGGDGSPFTMQRWCALSRTDSRRVQASLGNTSKDVLQKDDNADKCKKRGVEALKCREGAAALLLELEDKVQEVTGQRVARASALDSTRAQGVGALASAFKTR